MCRPQDALPPHLLPHTPPARSTRIVHTTTVTTTTTASPVRAQSPVDMISKVTHYLPVFDLCINMIFIHFFFFFFEITCFSIRNTITVSSVGSL